MVSLYIWIATQIITESFPISSSSHLKLLASIIKKYGNAYFLSVMPRYFDDLLHGPSLLVIALFFFKRWSFLLLHFLRCIYIIRGIILRTFISASITVVFYFLFDYWIDVTRFPVSLGLAISSALLFSSRYCSTKDFKPITLTMSVVLGFVQGLSLLPGISRLGATYVAARWLKLSPRHALETSFVIQAPLIGAAFVRAVYFIIFDPYITEFLNVQTGLR